MLDFGTRYSMRVKTQVNEAKKWLVPDEGKAPTVAGEMIRAICRLWYRWHNDGDAVDRCGMPEVISGAYHYLEAKGSDDVLCFLHGLKEVPVNGYDEVLLMVADYILEDIMNERPDLKFTLEPDGFDAYKDELDYIDEEDGDEDEEY